MKKITTLSLLLCGFFFLYSQDIITKKNGEEIKAKIIDVNGADIAYKKWENIEGPSYHIDTMEVFMTKLEKTGDKTIYGYNPKSVEKKEEVIPKAESQKAIADTVATLKKEIINYRAVSKYDSLMKIGKTTKAVGIALTVLAPLDLISGIVLLAITPAATANGDNNTRELNIGIGSFAVVTGVIGLIVGPISIVKGNKQIVSAQQYKGGAYLSPPVVGLNYSFGSSSPRPSIGTRITF